MTQDQFLKDFNKGLLDLRCQHSTSGILLLDPFELLIILQKELQIGTGNINLKIGPKFPMGLQILLPSRKGMLFDLSLNLLGSVSQKYCRVGIA